MFNFDDDFYRRIERKLRQIAEVEQAKSQLEGRAQERSISDFYYKVLEHHCTSSVTDEDMLQLHIDYALDTGNKEMFMGLTKQLNGVQQDESRSKTSVF